MVDAWEDTMVLFMHTELVFFHPIPDKLYFLNIYLTSNIASNAKGLLKQCSRCEFLELQLYLVV